mmetsp:Transcript_58/g.151  ORF Transcript_58/g.151 Transcript_58/m.151 type:complete len:263 (-) Transcript_58:136-924(-)
MLKSITSRRLANGTYNNAILRAVVGNSSATRPVSTTSFSIQQQQQQQRTNRYNSAGTITAPRSQYRRWLSDTSSKASPDTEEKKEEEPKTPDEGEDAGEAPAEEETPSETETLKAELSDMKDQLLRSLAEQENIRSIARRDVEAARNFSVKSFAKSLLEVADNLDRALESVEEEEVQKNTTLKTFVEGIEMTGSGLTKALQSNGVVAFCDQPGEEFDAEKHQALMEYADPNATPGTVGTVMKKGYTLNGRVLRAAEVGIIKK